MIYVYFGFCCRNMANVYVGFHDQRNSSRVLKPPGGGTSNIFGGEIIPDVIPQNSSRKETKHRGSSIQDVISTETVTTTVTTTSEEKSSSSTNGNVAVEEHINVCKLQNNDDVSEVVEPADYPDVAAEVTCKVEQMKIEERSSKSEMTETDAAGNTKVIFSDSNSEGSVEQNSSFKKGSSIGAILNEDEILEKKKIKGQHSPNQRVPPGGYSSGLW